MSSNRVRTDGLTLEELDALPVGSRVEDKDEDQYVKFLADDGMTALWVDPEQGESTGTIVLYGGVRVISQPEVIPPPATNERLVEVAKRVVDIYFTGSGDTRAFIDAMTTLNIELSTLETP